MPLKHKEVKTKVVKSNPNPLFVETIKFQMPQERFSDRILVLHVVDKDTFTKDDKLGEVQVLLNTIDLNRKSTFVRELGPMTDIVTSDKSSSMRSRSRSSRRRSSSSSSSRDSSNVEDWRKSAPAPSEYDDGPCCTCNVL